MGKGRKDAKPTRKRKRMLRKRRDWETEKLAKKWMQGRVKKWLTKNGTAPTSTGTDRPNRKEEGETEEEEEEEMVMDNESEYRDAEAAMEVYIYEIILGRLGPLINGVKPYHDYGDGR